jgi:hypothetical protein
MEMPLVSVQIVSRISKVTHRFLPCPAPSDYTSTTDTFTFSATQNRDCVDVPIISDNIVEVSESFFGNLDTTAPRVTLAPDVTEITITDEDRKSVGRFVHAPFLKSDIDNYLQKLLLVLSSHPMLFLKVGGCSKCVQRSSLEI